MYNSVDFRIFPNVVQITPLSDSRTFPSPLKETSCPLAVSLTSPLPHLLAMTNLFLVNMDLPVLYSQLIFIKGGKNVQWRKDSPFSNWHWESWMATCKTMKLDHGLSLHMKINSKWHKDKIPENS